MSDLTYLFAAYTAVWLVLGAYVWRLSRRVEQVRRELEDLAREGSVDHRTLASKDARMGDES